MPVLDAVRRERFRAACTVARNDAVTAGRDVTVTEVLQRAARRRRYGLRRTMQQITAMPRLAGCGRKHHNPVVSLRLGDRGAGFAGVAFCESIWSCPCCSASLRSARAEEIQDAAARHVRNGGGALFVTLTVPHGRSDSLRDLLRDVTKGWGHIMNSKGTRKDLGGRDWRERLGVVGYIRAVEVTHGRSGWHPHLHLLVLTNGDVGADTRRAFTAWLRHRWVAYCAKRDWKGTEGRYGVNIQDVVSADAVARYIGKVQDAVGGERIMGHELARADLKSGRRKGITPFGMLEEHATASETRRVQIEALWREYERETKGLSALRWSPGLRDRLDVLEKSDREILEDLNLGDNQRTVCLIPAADWFVLTTTGGTIRALEVAETQGEAAARDYIRDHIADQLAQWAAEIEAVFSEERPDVPNYPRERPRPLRA